MDPSTLTIFPIAAARDVGLYEDLRVLVPPTKSHSRVSLRAFVRLEVDSSDKTKRTSVHRFCGQHLRSCFHCVKVSLAKNRECFKAYLTMPLIF